MGSCGEDSNKGIDATAGGLVWVRRRNGSWWPGQILGPEELPEGCVPTLRSGTPIKLLGKEDASVDWYNLEKSKRVKSFHCGEYEDCIKKVKESASHLSKKGAKYARREDAILHALELEGARLGVTQDGEHDHADKSSYLNSSGDDSDLVSQSDQSVVGPDHIDPVEEDAKQNDSEDDGYGGVKRMRGLGDLGIGIASSIKKKRSQVADVHVHELLKKKNRHRPLTKVMASATMGSVPSADIEVRGLEYGESKKNDSVVINISNSDSNGVLDEDGTLLYATARLSQSGRVEAKPLANEAANVHEINQSLEKGTSEWRFKGKRNSRLRKVANEADTNATGVDRESFLTTFGRNANSKNHGQLSPFSDNEGYHVKSRPAGIRGWSWNSPRRESPEQHTYKRLLPYRQSRFTVNPKYDGSDISLRHHIAVSGLYEVNVKVKTSHRPQHVPYISLMSKLTGRPIIGHPLTIEVLGDDFFDSVISNSECNISCSELKRKPQRRHSTKPGSESPRSRRNTLLSKKTRKLSSLTTTASHRLGRGETKPLLEKLKGPSIACVPLKIVFSRINAALTSSVRLTPRPTSTASNALF